jgi:dolichol-phosphate mannosyltransferase
LPVYNEEQVLDELFRSVAEALAGCAPRFEIVFVNDGSRDGSPARLDQLAASSPHVRVVHLSRNFGHQAAVQAGLAHARGDAVILMDSDLQDTPAAIPRFLAEWRAGYDIVYAVRSERKEGRLKKLLFNLFYRLLAAVSNTRMPLDAGNFGLIDRRAVRDILALAERDRYLPGLRAWVGYRQKGIVVERAARYDSQPRVSFWGLVRLAKTAVFSFSTFPLAVFYFLGLCALAAFTALGGYSLFCKLFTDLAIPGWTSHVLCACFFGAINALGISILGEYVVRIYDQVRGRPFYLVDRVTGGPPARAAADPADAACAALLAQVESVLAEAQQGCLPPRDPAARDLAAPQEPAPDLAALTAARTT